MASSSSQHRCVFVGNIPYDATEEQLIQICEEVGPVVSFRLVLDRETGKPKGYGFCEYKDEETALSARRNLQGYEINGRQLRVDFAENDKGTDRNREQGRGGPGLTSNIDAQKPSGAPSILGDSSLHQPIGLPLAATAASVMAGALGEAQISGMSSNQNGLQSQSGLGNDPLTHYLAKMSRHQLYEIISEMKAFATQNKALARQLLQTSVQLPKALFQAQIMLGMVTPQMLQMPNLRQSSSSAPQPLLQDGVQDQKPVLPPLHGQTPQQNVTQLGMLARLPDGQAPTLAQNHLIPHCSALPLQHGTMQPRFQYPHSAQALHMSQATIPGKPGVPTVPSVQPQSLGGFSVRTQTPPLVTSKGLVSQTQPPFLQQLRPIGATNVGHHPQLALPNTSIQQSLLPHPLSSQTGSSNYPILTGGPDTVLRDAGTSASPSHDSTWGSRINVHRSSVMGLAEQTSMARDVLELANLPSKHVKLEDGSSAPQMLSSNVSMIKSEPAQAFDTRLTSASQMVGTDGMQHSEKQTPQLPPEVESALLQQVMSLTSEQLSSLPPEQRQQVIQLQQMLR